MALITLRDIRAAYGGPPILDGVDLTIQPGERLCLVGRNGSGKSTLLRLIAGELTPDAGEISRRQGLKIGHLGQDVPPGIEGTVFDVAASGMGEVAETLAEYHRVSHALAERQGVNRPLAEHHGFSQARAEEPALHPESQTPESGSQGAGPAAGESGPGSLTSARSPAHRADPSSIARLAARQQELQRILEDSGGWEVHHKVERILSRLSLDPDADFASLSGGTKRRALLARALVCKPDILLLDEPTNQLDIDTILWLEEFLLREARTLVFVTHDRAFARRLATRVVELDRGRLITFQCGYDEFRRRREDLLEAEASRAAEFDRKLAEEEAWVRRGIKARRTRNEGRVRALLEMRQARALRRERSGQVKLEISETDSTGRLFCLAKGVSFAYGEKPVIRDLTATVLQGDRVGIIGPNGSGKTTLLRILAGDLEPQGGAIRRGKRLDVIYFDQLREQLDPLLSARENVGQGNEAVMVNGRSRHVLAYLRDFLFTPERAQTPVRVLSGGERNRVLLAKLFTRPCNVLVLDEPTNDLDEETLDLLEDLLLEFQGTLLLVSHDRDFLNNAVTSTLAVDADGVVREYVGGYDDWVRQGGPEAAASHGRPGRTAEVAGKGRQARPAASGEGQAPRSNETSEEGGPGRSTGPFGDDEPEKSARTRRDQGKESKPSRRKLSYKEERELESLPARIEDLEAAQARLHESLADPEIYRTAGDTVGELTARLETIAQELEAAFARWEELESRRD